MGSGQTHPPRWAVWLLIRLSRRADRYSLIDDLEIEFTDLSNERGRPVASVWYIAHVFRSVPELIYHILYLRTAMIKNYTKIALRNIRKQKTFSLINISGLAVGMACCILILLWVRDELSYETSHVNAHRVCRVLSISRNPDGVVSAWDGTPGLLGPTLEAEYPEIEKAVRTVPQLRCAMRTDDSQFYADCTATESSFFEIFSCPFIKGDPAAALETPGSIVITRSTAEKFFGDEDPVGKTVNLNFWRSNDLLVTGVIEDIPNNSHLRFDCLFHFSVLRRLGWDIDAWGGTNNKTYVMLADDLDYTDVERKISGIYQQHDPQRTSTVRLEPITRIHLFNAMGGGAFTVILIFSSLGIVILLTACINFTNLSTARAAMRIKEVGLRKVVGADIPQLRLQFMGESILLSLLALFVALVLVYLFLPAFNNLAGKSLTLNFSIATSIQVLLIALFTGTVSGLYPATILSAFKPHTILKSGGATGGKSSLLRKGLVVFQFTTSLFLIISVITLNKQMAFIQGKDLGFEKDQILALRTTSDLKRNYAPLKQELLKNPEIAAMTMINGSFVGLNSSSSEMRWEGMPENTKVQMLIHSVDHDYLRTFDLRMVEGRFFSEAFPSDAREGVVLNEAAVRALGLSDPVGKAFTCPTPARTIDGRIIGVIKDYHVSSLRENIRPMALVVVPGWYTKFYIRMKTGNVSGTLNDIRKTFRAMIPEYVFEYEFLDERINRLYRAETRQSGISSILTLISIFISCLGLFGLVSFTTERRTKEIGIRKVLGAPVHGIVGILTKDFVKCVILANIVAWPVAYIAMSRWLRNFAYRTDISIGSFIFSTFIILAIACATVSFQSIKAAAANPVDTLRYE